MKPIIEIHNLSKKFMINHEQNPYLSIRDSLSYFLSDPLKKMNKTEPFWALKDINFNVMPGDTVGIIGKNGAGKSTLLKILSKITPPTSGKIIGRGRIASLLEVGTGFHSELSGRENVFMNGSILGMKRAEILKNFDAIVDFAGVEKFIDTPLKHYSSGMQLRLAFAVAAFLENEILIIDEVLAVGDAEFQKKCMGKMGDVSKNQGKTVLFVSHNMAAVKNLCNTAILLNEGSLLNQCDTSKIIEQYLHLDKKKAHFHFWKSNSKIDKLHFNEVEIIELYGNQPEIVLHIRLKMLGAKVEKEGFFAFDFRDNEDYPICQSIPNYFLNNNMVGKSINFKIFLPALIPGEYRVSVWHGPHNTETYDYQENILLFKIVEPPIKGRSFPFTKNHGNLIIRSEVI